MRWIKPVVGWRSLCWPRQVMAAGALAAGCTRWPMANANEAEGAGIWVAGASSTDCAPNSMDGATWQASSCQATGRGRRGTARRRLPLSNLLVGRRYRNRCLRPVRASVRGPE